MLNDPHGVLVCCSRDDRDTAAHAEFEAVLRGRPILSPIGRATRGCARKGIARTTRALVLIASLWDFAALANAASPDPLAVAFGTRPALWGVQLSPDGSKISFLQMHSQDLAILTVLDLTTEKANVALASTPDGFDIQWCDWANNERLLCGFDAVAKQGWDAYGVTRLVAINADGSQMKVLLQRKLWDEFAQFQDRVVDWLVDDPKRVLVIIPSRKGATLNPLDIYSGGTGLAIDKQAGFVTWVSDNRGSPRLHRYVGEDQIRWEYRLAGERKWRLLDRAKMTDLDHDYYPLGFGEESNRLLVVKPHDGRLALWSEDLTGGSEDELVFSDPGVDVGGVLRLGKFKRIVAVGYSTDRWQFHFFDALIEKISSVLAEHIEGKEISVTDESWDGRYYIIFAYSDRDPGTYYRFDVQKAQLLRIAPKYPQLESKSLAPMSPIRYPARDGTQIPGYLTLPSGATEHPLPAVILPHGGPEYLDY
jgi:dipeptidyl aminopeptidase/acylaminoacyl peptidase